jgi:D-alanyl-D-alanine carboxypeptidase/D-alanyl-D-alanine-endopeptidase (penicillin-binding protein 4)
MRLSVVRAGAMICCAMAALVSTTPASGAPAPIRPGAVLLQQSATRGTAPRTSARRTTPARKPAARRTTAKRVVAPVLPELRFTTPRGTTALAADLGALIGLGTRSGDWGAIVVSLTQGDTLFATNADRALVPASTMKTFTAALALERLGAQHAFSTDVLRHGPIDTDGVVRGDLVLRGDGDPGLSPRFIKGGADAPMTLLAEFVAGAGVKRVEGDLVVDGSALEDRRIPEGWLARWEGLSYAAPFSGLSLNENIVIVGVRPNGGRAEVQLEPVTSALEVISDVRVVRGRATQLRVTMVGESQVSVTGTISASAQPYRVQLVVKDPVTFAAGAFREALRAKGIVVTGEVRLGRTPDDEVLVTSLPSPSVARLVSVMNRESNNHYAEQLFRNAARGPGRDQPGSAAHAYQTLREFLESRVGVAPGQVVATDGSGLSVLDRVTPRALVQLMAYAHRAPWGSVFHASLPVAGESETLRLRMRDTPAAGNLHAKTGTTNEVVSLAGYATAENGELLAFAFLYNGTDRYRARETIDAMGPTLAGFSR